MVEKISFSKNKQNVQRILLFSDTYGAPMAFKVIPSTLFCGLVAAEIRPNQLVELHQLAAEQGVPLLLQPRSSSPTFPDFVNQVNELKPDMILSHSYSMLIPPAILSIPQRGGINIHGALLPRYRGANPIQWALINNDIETGVTMHLMSAEFDRGDIIAQRRVPIFFEDTWLDIFKRIACATEAMLKEEMPKVINGKVTRIPQNESEACYYHRRRPQDGLIDWQKDVLSIYNLIRALVQPLPGAFYFRGDEKVILDTYLTIHQVTELKYSTNEGGEMLKSKRISLCPLNIHDLPELSNWINDRQNILFASSCKPIDQWFIEDWFETIQKQNDIVVFGIRLISTDKIIGIGMLHTINYINRSAEMQIQMCEGVELEQDYSAEAIRLLLNFAFHDLSLHSVYLHVINTSVVALQIAEKVGFVREGILRQAVNVNGEYVDVVAMRILRGESVNLFSSG
jgi:methionyl-tRNA formyltransferase